MIKSQNKFEECVASLKHFTHQVYEKEGNKEGELM